MDYYQVPELRKQYPEIQHGFSYKNLGNMSFRWGSAEEVVENRRRFYNLLGVDYKDVVAIQLKGKDGIKVVNREQAGIYALNSKKRLECDAIITNISGLFLFLVVADCHPIILYDKERKAIALVHAGAAGTYSRIVPKTIKLMQKEYGSSPKDIVATIGPGIRADSYTFDPDDRFRSKKEWLPYLGRVNGRTSVDVIAYNSNQLKEMGVEKVFESPIDVFKDKRFFSHVRSYQTGEKEGRFGCMVGLSLRR